MFKGAFSSITKMLIKKASLDFEENNTAKSLSEHKLKCCGQNSVNRSGMQDVLPAQNWTKFFLRHLKSQQLEKTLNLAAAQNSQAVQVSIHFLVRLEDHLVDP